MMKKLFLFPFGGNAKETLLSVLAINNIKKEWELAGFIDDDRSLWGKECCGIKVLGGREIFSEYPDARIIAAHGNPETFMKRRAIIEALGLDESRYATIVHPSVTVAPDSVIGHNVSLMANCFVSCGVRIGNHCVFLPNTVIAHDSMVGDYCLVGSNVTISGEVKVGAGCYIGSGARVRNNISIGAGSLVGLGSNVVSDIPDGVVAAGNPARIMRKV